MLQNTDMKERQCPDSRPPSRKIQSKVQVFDTSVWGYKQADMCHYSHECGSTIYISNIPGAFKYPSLCTCSAVFFFFLNFFLSLYNKNGIVQFSSVQLLSCVWLCDPMNRSMPGLPVHHRLLESTQTHVHWVGDATQPSTLSSPSPPALNLSQHQGLFKLLSSSQVAKVLEFQLQHQSFQWTPRTDLL